MTADRRHCVDARGSAPSRHGAAAAWLAVRVVVRGRVETAAEVLRDRLAEPWTFTALAEEVHLPRSAVRYAPVHIGVWGGGTHGRARTAGHERHADRQQERYNDRPAWRMAAELPFQDACSLPLSP